MNRYRCNHFTFEKAYIFLHPEEYGHTVPINQCRHINENCAMCMAKNRMDRAWEEYKSNEVVFLKYKAIQEAGENFFTFVSDEMREQKFKEMNAELNVFEEVERKIR